MPNQLKYFRVYGAINKNRAATADDDVTVKEYGANYWKPSGNIDDSSLENSKYGIIEIVENGFQINNASNPESIYFAWADTTEIVTFKRDLGTTDLICLGFKTEEDTFMESTKKCLDLRFYANRC